MAQPKTPPLSIRPGDERLTKIDEFAEARKITRHAAALALIDAGLRMPKLSLEAVFKIDAIKAAAGGTDAAISAAILAWNGPGEPKPVVKKRAKADKPKVIAKAPANNPEAIRKSHAEKRIKPDDAENRIAEVPLLQRKAFNPQPKKGKAK